MSNNFEKQKGRRSSLKSHNNNQIDAAELLKIKNKRNSVSWGQSSMFQFKAMKAMFQESKEINKPTKETQEKHKQFVESRKKSIKDEFSIVREMIKNKNIIEEEDIDEEVKNNTNKNFLIGKEGLNKENESSHSSENESDENQKKVSI